LEQRSIVVECSLRKMSRNMNEFDADRQNPEAVKLNPVNRVVWPLGWSVIVGIVGGKVLHGLIGEAHAPALDGAFTIFIVVGCTVVAYGVLSKLRRERLSYEQRNTIKLVSMLAGGWLVLTWLVQCWQDATAIPCQDDPQHEHVVCRLANGDLQYWTAAE
jgi:hypothetical protein